MKKIKIDPERWYNLQEIIKGRMFPWAGGRFNVRTIVALDRRNKNILKANITGTGRATKYHFKGSNIEKFIEAFESGKITL